jgi:hypothetical protein
MTPSEIEVEGVVHEQPAEGFFGYFKVKEAIGDRLRIVGWAFAEAEVVSEVEVVVARKVVATALPATPRPDVAELYPQTPSSLTSGFEIEIEAQGGGRSELAVVAVTGGGERFSLGTVTVDVSQMRGSRWPWKAERA